MGRTVTPVPVFENDVLMILRVGDKKFRHEFMNIDQRILPVRFPGRDRMVSRILIPFEYNFIFRIVPGVALHMPQARNMINGSIIRVVVFFPGLFFHICLNHIFTAVPLALTISIAESFPTVS